MSTTPTSPAGGNRRRPSGPHRRIGLWTVVTVTTVVVVVLGTFIVLQVLGVFASHRSNTREDAVQQTATSSTIAHRTPSSKPPGNSGVPGINPPTKQQATALISQYYDAIDAQNYKAAYDLWGNAFRSSTSYDTFAKGFTDTQKDVVQYGSPSSLSDGTVKVPVTISATVSMGMNSYQGYYILGVESGTTKILDANIELTASTNNRVKQAVAVVNQYFAYINAKNYQAAYNLWGTAYHNNTPYQQFAAGFANTQSVSIAIPFGDVSVLKEGSVQVPLIVTSLDKANAGMVKHIFLGYYIVGTEGTTWQLFSANVHQVN
jgi:hypothetical protein